MTKPDKLTLEQWVTESALFAAHTFNERGELMAMWIGEAEDGTIMPILAPISDKDATIRAVRKIFVEHKVKRYVFMTEAWTVAARDKDDEATMEYARHHSLKDHPDRREVIMVTGEDKSQAIMGQMAILRPEHGKPTVSPFKILTMDRMEGRMTGLLP